MTCYAVVKRCVPKIISKPIQYQTIMGNFYSCHTVEIREWLFPNRTRIYLLTSIGIMLLMVIWDTIPSYCTLSYILHHKMENIIKNTFWEDDTKKWKPNSLWSVSYYLCHISYTKNDNLFGCKWILHNLIKFVDIILCIDLLTNEIIQSKYRYWKLLSQVQEFTNI